MQSPKEYFVIHGDKVTEITENKGKCDFCERSCSTINVIVTSDSEHKKFNACEICKSVVIYNRVEMYRTIYLKSKLSQKDVIKKTVEYYFKNGSLPSPNNLDSRVKLLDMSSPNLKQWRCYNKKINKIVIDKGIVAFLNPEFILNKILIRSFCAESKENKTYWRDVGNLKRYEIKNKVESYIKKTIINSETLTMIEESAKKLNAKIKESEKLIKLGV